MPLEQLDGTTLFLGHAEAQEREGGGQKRRRTTTVRDNVIICPAAASLTPSVSLSPSTLLTTNRVSTLRQQHSVATVTLSGKDAPCQRSGCRHSVVVSSGEITACTTCW